MLNEILLRKNFHFSAPESEKCFWTNNTRQLSSVQEDTFIGREEAECKIFIPTSCPVLDSAIFSSDITWTDNV